MRYYWRYPAGDIIMVSSRGAESFKRTQKGQGSHQFATFPLRGSKILSRGSEIPGRHRRGGHVRPRAREPRCKQPETSSRCHDAARWYLKGRKKGRGDVSTDAKRTRKPSILHVSLTRPSSPRRSRPPEGANHMHVPPTWNSSPSFFIVRPLCPIFA